jgi:acyl-CoA thioesterase FadM
MYWIRSYSIYYNFSQQQRRAQQQAQNDYYLIRKLHHGSSVTALPPNLVKPLAVVVPVRSLGHISLLSGLVWPIDLDPRAHMTNSRYLREGDFGRIKFLGEIGVWTALERRNEELERKTGKNNVFIVAAGTAVQYKRSLQLWERFTVATSLAGWDEKAFYVQQIFTLDQENHNKNKKIDSDTASDSSNSKANCNGSGAENKQATQQPIVCCTQLVRMMCYGKSANGEKITPRLLLQDLGYENLTPPPLPEAVKSFRDYCVNFKPPLSNRPPYLKSNL